MVVLFFMCLVCTIELSLTVVSATKGSVTFRIDFRGPRVGDELGILTDRPEEGE